MVLTNTLNIRQIKNIYFTFNLKLNLYCYHKRIKTLTFASIYNYKRKVTENNNELL